MKLFAPVAIALAMTAAAQAQTNSARVEFQAIPNTIPGLLIDPSPLSGTLLKPLSQGAGETVPVQPAEMPPEMPAAAISTAAAEPEPVAEPALDAAAAIVTGTAPAALPDAAPDTIVQPAPDPVPETATEPEPEPAPEPEPETAAPSAPAVSPSSGGTITVIVEGVESAQGVVNVAVCDKDLSEEGCPHSTTVKAAAGFVEARFDDIAPGTYAVVGYHDVNGNDEFDKFLGVPREPYALSNRAGEKMVPTFRDAALKVNQGDNTVIIRLQRLLGG